MMHLPSIDVLTIFFLLSCSPFHLAKGDTICSDKSAVPSKSILTVGMLSSKLLVVTEPDNQTYTQYIYEMPVSSLNDSVDQLFLNDDPKKLKDFWPVLYNSTFYAANVFSGPIYNSFTAIDKVSEYFFITSLNEEGVVYDIKNEKAFKGLHKRQKKDTREVLISSDKLQKFFAVQVSDNGGLAIMRFKFITDTVIESLKSKEVIVPENEGAYHPLCKVGNDSMMVMKKELLSADDDKDKNGTNKTCEPLKYPLSKGFVSKKKIYLFGQDKIYIFSESFYDTPNVPVKVIIKAYSSFINCKTQAEHKTDKISGMSIGLIIGIVLAVLIVILCLVLFCTREVIRHKRRQKHRKKKKKEAEKRKAEGGGKAGEKVADKEEDDEPAGPMGSFLSFFMPSVRSDDVTGDDNKGKKSAQSSINSQASVRSAASQNSKASVVLSKVNKKQGKGSSTVDGQLKQGPKSKLLQKDSKAASSSTISANLAISKAKGGAGKSKSKVGAASSSKLGASSSVYGAGKKGGDKKKNSKVK